MLDLAVIIVLAPGALFIGALLALVVRVGSPGPVLFRQRRVGFLGREFTCYKFRTMRDGAETDSHRHHTERLMSAGVPMVKLDAHADPRLIPFGAALRATGLDELPQLINVLRGEMSLVGPRPCVVYEYERYNASHRRRFEAVPGLTGLWQVSGKNRTTFEEMIRLDVEYARRKSLGLDLKILLITLPALWTQCRDIRAMKRRKARRPVAEIGKSAESLHL
jgi:lipopolysaccharide/colanic/teichoic acid biosynthesis glycosyltransferase